jgi:hypothetical protein
MPVHGVLDGAYQSGWEHLSRAEQATKLCQLVDHIVEHEDGAKRFLKQQSLFQRWFALVSPHPPAPDFQTDAVFFAAAAGRGAADSEATWSPSHGRRSRR